jgi:MoaA/NifB/PqqE/SkfB family radical SAM enzyme
MTAHYTPRDYLHFGRMLWRHRRRQRVWQRHFEISVRDASFRLPHATCVTIVPTESCNLRCPMCNQWGESGYFLAGARQAQHMEADGMSRLLGELSPRDTLLSVHGGEPFAYKHIDALLTHAGERRFDVLVTTNGTLMKRHLESLAGIENLALLFSIDGNEATHDRIRGAGNFRRSRDGLEALFELRRRRGMPLPLVVMSFVVCEWTTDAIEEAYAVAKDFGVFALNYTMRYFLPEEAGVAYERHLQEHFGVRSSGAWRGWISKSHEQHDYAKGAATLAGVLRRRWLRLLPPYVTIMPRGLKGRAVADYFGDYLNVFGNETCFMPFYWARVHANGDMIYCPGHPDIIVGNVFRDGFMAAFNSDLSIGFRKHILHHRLPICNRCCGLYIPYAGRRHEQQARRRLGLSPHATVHYP